MDANSGCACYGVLDYFGSMPWEGHPYAPSHFAPHLPLNKDIGGAPGRPRDNRRHARSCGTTPRSRRPTQPAGQLSDKVARRRATLSDNWRHAGPGMTRLKHNY